MPAFSISPVSVRTRSSIVGSLFLGVEGVLERTGKVINVKATRLYSLSLQEGQEGQGAPGKPGGGKRELLRPVGFG